MTGLPLWVQVLNIAVTFALAAIKVVEFLRRGKLEVRLTKDSFFRLTDGGEALFAHAVLLAREGPVLIDDVSLTMTRLATLGSKSAVKSFPFQIVNHGEKVKGPAIQAEHHFYGSSPLLYVSAASTQRTVYMCLHSEYKEKQQQCLVDFDNEFHSYKRATEGLMKQLAEIAKEIDPMVRQHYEKMCGLIQLESGSYELVLTISYEKVGFWVPNRRSSTRSFGYFSVNDEKLMAYKNHLLRVLFVRATNIIKGDSLEFPYPEYNPSDFMEAKERRATQK